jgi:ATP-binding cassette subfamily B protein
VLDGGRVVEQGTHAELLAANGAYRALWRAGDLAAA